MKKGTTLYFPLLVECNVKALSILYLLLCRVDMDRLRALSKDPTVAPWELGLECPTICSATQSLNSQSHHCPTKTLYLLVYNIALLWAVVTKMSTFIHMKYIICIENAFSADYKTLW